MSEQGRKKREIRNTLQKKKKNKWANMKKKKTLT